MRLVVAFVVLAAASVAHAANTNGFEKYVSDLATAPAQAAKRLTAACEMVVTPGGAVRRPCKLELADLVGTAQGVTLTAKNVKRQSFDRSMLEWIEADVEARANKKVVATFHVIELGGQGNPDNPNDGWGVSAQMWSRLVADKDAAAHAVAPAAIADSITPLPKGTSAQDAADREQVVHTMKQVLTQGGLKDALEMFAADGAIVIGSAPGQRYTGKSGASAIHGWKMTMTQKGGIAIGGGSFVAFAVTDVVGKAATEVPYVAFVVYIQRLTGGGSPAPFPALVMFAVPQ